MIGTERSQPAPPAASSRKPASDCREGGSFRLRHNSAIRQLRRGIAPEQVARWLGIAPVKMKHYERVMQMPVEVV